MVSVGLTILGLALISSMHDCRNAVTLLPLFADFGTNFFNHAGKIASSRTARLAKIVDMFPDLPMSANQR